MLSSFPTLLPFLLFAFVASITPGPTNILVLSNSARFGLMAAVPIIFGACASAAILVLLVGTGAGSTLTTWPALQTAMQWGGVVWLTYLAWQIFRAPMATITTHKPRGASRIARRCGLQWINPKTWMMALAVVSVFAGAGEDRFAHVMVLSLVFFLISLPCLGVWACSAQAPAAGCAHPLRCNVSIVAWPCCCWARHGLACWPDRRLSV